MRATVRVAREIYRRELLPATVRWSMAASGMYTWIRGLEKSLREDLGSESKPVLASLTRTLFERRYAELARRADLPRPESDPRSVALVMGGLYQTELPGRRRGAWIFDGLGGPPSGLRERFRAQRLVLPLSAEARWLEVATHLGELLIVITEELPQHLPRARPRVASICFDMGVRYAERARATFGMDDEDPAKSAIEVLRISEYIFCVNPSHWSQTDPRARSGWLEGDACLWWSRPGWNGGHCGIFGQFQAGVCSVFGLDYKLSKTIPKHGGDTCRVSLVPLRRRDQDAPAPAT